MNEETGNHESINYFYNFCIVDLVSVDFNNWFQAHELGKTSPDNSQKCWNSLYYRRLESVCSKTKAGCDISKRKFLFIRVISHQTLSSVGADSLIPKTCVDVYMYMYVGLYVCEYIKLCVANFMPNPQIVMIGNTYGKSSVIYIHNVVNQYPSTYWHW